MASSFVSLQQGLRRCILALSACFIFFGVSYHVWTSVTSAVAQRQWLLLLLVASATLAALFCVVRSSRVRSDWNAHQEFATEEKPVLPRLLPCLSRRRKKPYTLPLFDNRRKDPKESKKLEIRVTTDIDVTAAIGVEASPAYDVTVTGQLGAAQQR
ncbi:hypothetical protein BDY21DRAFT_370041 [Lineolata rhizophorae]|uniref:Transmembrane protein n=1 Tax=Lineolata rhizophorae TaxID=578093 RepID=A0A6A6P8G1_9PEZI|nr:hypothetical protein BDY21DRAFT_370041 [Lineolata rhizophorae]